jgi:acetylornithine deacetylase/succinyl-diaminopimelate desuccinylase-like protein
MQFQQVHDYIDRHFTEHLLKIQEFLRIRSTRDGLNLNVAARWVAEFLRSLGARPELVGPENAPVVFARLDAGRPKSLLVYGMYDVQPVDDQDWSSPPFAAAIQERPGVGPCVIARGACNSKGPLAAFLNALQAMREAGQLPVNLILTVEGEEESGSPFLPRFYQENKERLRADAAFEPFWADYGTDVDRPGRRPRTKPPLWCQGPTKDPVHSSVGAWLASPTWRLFKALNTFLNDREEITIADINKEVLPPRPEDEALLAGLQKTFDERKVLEILGAQRFKHDLGGVDLLRRYLFSPTLQVLLQSQAAGDVIPPQARAEVVIRLVPNMDPDRTVEIVHRHLKAHGYADFEVRKLAGYPASRTDLAEEVVQSLIAAYRYHGYEPQVWPLLPSATPYYLFSDVLGIPYTWGGLGQAGRSHSVDEFASVAGLQLFEKSVVTFLHQFGRAS